MFDRERIKNQAKDAVRRRYWIVIIVAVIVGLLGGSLSGTADGGSITLNTDRISSFFESDTDTNVDADPGVWEDSAANPWEDSANADDLYAGEQTLPEIWAEFKAELNTIMEEFARELGVDLQTGLSIFLGVLIGLAALFTVFALLYNIFLRNVITVGGHGWMLRHLRGEDVGIGEVAASFRIYKPSMVAMLVRGIYIWLWSLLFIFPSVVAYYAYSMVPYIIYENPNLSANEAIRISRKMTKGYKFDLFVLNLSFIGWDFLTVLSGGLLGIFWVNPYKGLAWAGAYDDLKWKAIQAGTLSWNDFGQLPPPAADPFADVWQTPAAEASPEADVWHTPTEIQ